jgi:hypothetical protein
MKISGPVSLSILRHDDKYIILWGDKHGDKRSYCKCKGNSKNCKFISTFIREIKDHYDLFIESPWYSQEEKRQLIGKQFVDVNAMRGMANTFFQDMYFHRTHSKAASKRVHFTDIRTEKTIRPLTDVVNAIMNIVYGATDTQGNLSWIETLQKYNTTHKLKRFVNNIIHDKKHKIFKQLSKLPRNEQGLVRKFHNDMCKMHISTTRAYDNSHYRLFHGEQKDYTDDMLNVLNHLLIWLSHLKDIYTICRMLFYLQKTRIVMSYDGDYHSKVYEFFFTKYLPRTEKVYEHKNSGTRCVAFSLHHLYDIFPQTQFQ